MNIKDLSKEECLELLPWNFDFYREPFQHQVQALIWTATQDNKFGFFLEQGLGKSQCAIDYLRLNQIHDKILVITVNFPLAHNWVNEFELNAPFLQGSVLEGTREQRIKLLNTSRNFYVINFEGVKTIFNELKNKEWEAIILDECFTCETLVKTVNGYKKIKDIKIGEKIFSKKGIDEVTFTFKREIPITDLLKITFLSKKEIYCSKNHLFYTIRGWVRAKNLCSTDVLVTLQENTNELFSMWKRNNEKESKILFPEMFGSKSSTRDTRMPKLWKTIRSYSNFPKKVLLFFLSLQIYKETNLSNTICYQKLYHLLQRICILRKVQNQNLFSLLFLKIKNFFRFIQKPIYSRESTKTINSFKKILSKPSREKRTTIQKNEGEPFNEQPYLPRKNESYITSNGAYFYNSRGEWTTITNPTSSTNEKLTMDSRFSSFARKTPKWLPNKLQSRFSSSNIKTWSRNRWCKPSLPNPKSTRYQKRLKTQGIRVGNITSYKQGGASEFRKCLAKNSINRKDDTIILYDLELKNHPSFYITTDNILVHNSRRVKDIKAQRTQLCIELGRNVPHKILLSGVPTVHPTDIFSQFLFLDEGESFGANFYSFRNKYFKDSSKEELIKQLLGCYEDKTIASLLRIGMDYVAKWREATGIQYNPNKKKIFVPKFRLRMQKWEFKNEEKETEFLEIVRKKSIRFLKREALDLPDKIYQRLYIHLTPQQEADYLKLLRKDKRLSVSTLTDRQLENCFMKYSQITGGFMKVGDNDYRYYPSNPKLDLLMDIVYDGIDSTKIVIFHRFIAEGRLIERQLQKAGILFSSMRSEIKDTTAEYHKFLQDENVRVMIAHPQSGGIGLNFTNSSICVYYSLDYSIEMKLQSEDRQHRIGQTQNVTYYHLLARDTIDDEVWKAHQEGIGLMRRVNDYQLTIEQAARGMGQQWKENF